MRVFLDANVLFSAAYSVRSNFRLLWAMDGVSLVTSTYVANETRRNVDEKCPSARADLAALLARTEVAAVPPGQLRPEGVTLREKDWPVLLGAIAMQADVLVTGDRHDFGPYIGRTINGVRIVPPGEFIRERQAVPRG